MQRGQQKMSVFDNVCEDVLHKILMRVPFPSFAAAACVNKFWYGVCRRILALPKLATALSLNPSLQVAVEEVLAKVLSEPIKPQFAISFVGPEFSLELTHKMITERLGAKIPVITHSACGIIGVDVDGVPNKVIEVMWDSDDDGSDYEEFNTPSNINRGIVLVVGNLPGLKVDAVPLVRSKNEPAFVRVDKFVIDIEEYTAFVSGSNVAPTGIIFFGDKRIDMKPVLAGIDYSIPEETVIVGDARSRFLCRTGEYFDKYCEDHYFFDAVALVLAKDKEKHPDVGDTHLHLVMSTGLEPFGPELQAAYVTLRGRSQCSWLTARSIEGSNGIIEGQGLLEGLHELVEDESPNFYIGAVQKVPCRPGPQASALKTYRAYYEVLRGEEKYFVLDGIGVQPGDTFLFYHTDVEHAKSSRVEAFEDLGVLKKSIHMNEVLGGLMFSCYSRGDMFFGGRTIDRFPFTKNFPDAPFAGMFCSAEIGRGPKSSSDMDGDQFEGAATARCSVHAYSCVYLVVSHVRAP